MWRQFLMASASALALAGTAAAADLPIAPPPPPPVFTWTGLYVGGYGGGEVTKTSYVTNILSPVTANSHLTLADIAGVNAAGSESVSKGGFTAGGVLGYNWQIGMFVLGFETDVGGVTGGTSNASAGFINGTGSPPGVFFPFSITQRVGNGLFGTARGRIGVAYNRFLLYGTGGLAYTSGTFGFNYSDGLFPATGSAATGNRVGWVVGGGLEYALTNNWSVKGEFLYSRFTQNIATGVIVNQANPTFTNTFRTSARVQNYTARVGLNYRFNWFAPLPVVARY